MQMYVFVALVLALFKDGFADPLCTEIATAACPGEIPDFPSNRTSVAPTNEALTEYCAAATPTLECRGRYAQLCENTEDPQPLRMLNFMNEMCDQTSELRIGYNQHVGCLNRMSDLVFNCVDIGKDGIQYYISKRSEVASILPNFEMHMECMMSRLTSKCITRHLQTTCDTDAANAFQAVFDKFDSEVMASTCRPELGIYLLYDMFQVIMERDRLKAEESENLVRRKRSFSKLRPALENLRAFFK